MKISGSTIGTRYFHKNTKQATTTTAATNFVNGRRDRKSSFLNDGYLTSLTIITERNTSNANNTQRHELVGRFFSSSQIRNIVNEATIAAEAGMTDYEACPEGVAAAELNAGRKAGARLIRCDSPLYPAQLRQIDGAPPILWVRGDPAWLSRNPVAVIGARNASSLGLRMAKSLARGLGEAGCVVVSGLARGIDAAAHGASLGTGTLAVMVGGDRAVFERGKPLLEIIGAGISYVGEIGSGTVAKLTAEGWEMVYVLCTDGSKGSSDREITGEELAQTRRREQLEAGKVLGLKDVAFLDYPDSMLEPTLDVRRDIAREIRRHRPDIVLTIDPNRPYIRHRDHTMTGRVTLDAVFPYARDHMAFPEHLQEGLEPHRVRELYLFRSESPDTFVDITDTFETKMDALYCHASQMGGSREEGDKRSRQRAAEVGENIGVPLAEGFKRVEIFR